MHYTQQSVSNYVKAAVSAAVDIHREGLPGDILIFLTGNLPTLLPRPLSLSALTYFHCSVQSQLADVPCLQC